MFGYSIARFGARGRLSRVGLDAGNRAASGGDHKLMLLFAVVSNKILAIGPIIMYCLNRACFGCN